MTELLEISEMPMTKTFDRKKYGFYSGYSSKASAVRAAGKWAYGYSSKIVKGEDGYALYLHSLLTKAKNVRRPYARGI